MKALVIVDMQYDFLPGGRLSVPRGDEVIPVINQLTSNYDLVVATQDWHPAHHKSFVTEHPGNKAFDLIDINGVQQVLWPPHCVQGTNGAALTSELCWNPVEAIFRKGMDPYIDSYSGFFDNNKSRDTGLGAYLRGRGINRVEVCGLAADFCVFYTAMDALHLGFEAAIHLNATRAINEETFVIKKENFVASGGVLL